MLNAFELWLPSSTLDPFFIIPVAKIVNRKNHFFVLIARHPYWALEVPR